MSDALNKDSQVAFIGFGEVGQILCQDLLAFGVRSIRVFDKAFANPAAAQLQACKKLGVIAASDAAQAAKDAHLVICAVTAANDLLAAQATAAGVRAAYYLDVNSASPAMKQSAAKVIEAGGGRYVEAAVMSPLPPKRIASPMLLGGPHAQAFKEAVSPLGFSGLTVFSDQLGRASATKMCRSVIVKGMEALLTESMLTARHYGVEDVVLKSLGDLFPLGDWNKLAHYMISRSIEHGTRKAEEMLEVARTVQDAGIEPLMSSASSAREAWAPRHMDALSNDQLASLLDAMLANVAQANTNQEITNQEKANQEKAA